MLHFVVDPVEQTDLNDRRFDAKVIWRNAIRRRFCNIRILDIRISDRVRFPILAVNARMRRGSFFSFSETDRLLCLCRHRSFVNV